jgi:hypothetical protein
MGRPSRRHRRFGVSVVHRSAMCFAVRSFTHGSSSTPNRSSRKWPESCSRNRQTHDRSTHSSDNAPSPGDGRGQFWRYSWYREQEAPGGPDVPAPRDDSDGCWPCGGWPPSSGTEALVPVPCLEHALKASAANTINRPRPFPPNGIEHPLGNDIIDKMTSHGAPAIRTPSAAWPEPSRHEPARFPRRPARAPKIAPAADLRRAAAVLRPRAPAHKPSLRTAATPRSHDGARWSRSLRDGQLTPQGARVLRRRGNLSGP